MQLHIYILNKCVILCTRSRSICTRELYFTLDVTHFLQISDIVSIRIVSLHKLHTQSTVYLEHKVLPVYIQDG